MLVKSCELPEPLILVNDNSLPNFTGKCFVDVGDDKVHVDIPKKLMPWDGRKKMKPGTILPNKTDSSS